MDGNTFLTNINLWSALSAWLVAQGCKMLICLVKDHKLDFSYLVSTGGMPSAHTAMSCALATSIGLRTGFGSPIFAVAFAFAVVVMFDAQNVRMAAGEQARLLNQIVSEFFAEHRLSENKMRELLGHTRLEVFFGLLTGILVAILLHALIG